MVVDPNRMGEAILGPNPWGEGSGTLEPGTQSMEGGGVGTLNPLSYIYIYVCLFFVFVCIRIRNVSGVSRRHVLETSKLEQPPLFFFWFRPEALMVPLLTDSNAQVHSVGKAHEVARHKVWRCRYLESVRGKHHYS